RNRETKVAGELAKVSENESRIASAEAELVKIQTEKSDLQGKLQANEAQIAELQKHIDEMNKYSANPNPGAPSVAELQAQLDDARKQLEGAEHEKNFIAERLGPTREQSRADRKSTRLNSSHRTISYAVFCLKKKKKTTTHQAQT